MIKLKNREILQDSFTASINYIKYVKNVKAKDIRDLINIYIITKYNSIISGKKIYNT